MPPDSDFWEGITKGILNWTTETIKELVKKLQEGNLAFVEDEETIQLVKETTKSSEWRLYGQYLNDKDLKIIVQMGLGLRKIENYPDKVDSLRGKILRKYGLKGLHKAQIVQNGLLYRFARYAIENYSPEDISDKIKDFLEHADKFISFIKSGESIESQLNKIKIKLIANTPPIFLIFSMGGARKIAYEILERMKKMNLIEGYTYGIEEDETRLLIYLIKKYIIL